MARSDENSSGMAGRGKPTATVPWLSLLLREGSRPRSLLVPHNTSKPSWLVYQRQRLVALDVELEHFYYLSSFFLSLHVERLVTNDSLLVSVSSLALALLS